jgi:hypothetical protein
MCNKIKAITDYKGLCFKCLSKDKPVDTFRIYGRGYGSGFDNSNTELQLCKECQPQGIKDWFDEEPDIIDGYCEDYKYEDNIFENTCSQDNYTMESQDYIDMKLGILPDEKYKEYGMYSPSEKKAYEDRFPNCKHVEIKVYGDGSKGSKCFMGAFGDGSGKCGLNMYDDCYLCDKYEERTVEIKVVDTVKEYYENETIRLKNMIAYATKRLEMIENKTLEMEY